MILFECVYVICIVIVYPTLNKHFLKIIEFGKRPFQSSAVQRPIR